MDFFKFLGKGLYCLHPTLRKVKRNSFCFAKCSGVVFLKLFPQCIQSFSFSLNFLLITVVIHALIILHRHDTNQDISAVCSMAVSQIFLIAFIASCGETPRCIRKSKEALMFAMLFSFMS